MERLKVKVAVYLVLKDGDNYLFSRRQNTGWMDGKLSLPSGHVDPGEMPVGGMIRESKEEIGIEILEKDLKFMHVEFRESAYIDFFFFAERYSGMPTNLEPEKCSELIWGKLEEYKNELIPSVYRVLSLIENNKFYSESLPYENLNLNRK